MDIFAASGMTTDWVKISTYILLQTMIQSRLQETEPVDNTYRPCWLLTSLLDTSPSNPATWYFQGRVLANHTSMIACTS